MEVDNTTDHSLDLEAPTLTKVEVSSTNTNTQGQLEQLAKEGDTITLTVESSEALKSLSVMGSDGSSTPLTAVGNYGPGVDPERYRRFRRQRGVEFHTRL